MIEQKSPVEKMSYRMRNSITIKLITVILLSLVLLIPTAMVRSIISEREHLSRNATNEVSAKWANRQQINGPVLSIPVQYQFVRDGKTVQTSKYWHILPKELNINGQIDPEKLKRGIYEVVVYKSKMSVNGTFALDEKLETSNVSKILYDKAFLTIGISDLRGIEDDIITNWNGQKLNVTPGSRISSMIYSGVTVSLPNLEELMDGNVDFSFDLKLQGSQNMSFVPLGSTTNIKLSSDWPSPMFDGSFLPDHREVDENGFNASWKVLQLNRNFPQSWLGPELFSKVGQSAFGVNLILPLDDYQKSMRSAKYAIMIIGLTFLVFFLVEVLNKRKIHPFQYALVGLALCLFYVLLVSISEHYGFNKAYAISSVAIVLMVTLYSVSVFKMPKLTGLLFLVITGVYGFLFTTLQLTDYALLMGSAGLTLILAATMYFTRNINWYKPND